MNEVTYLPQVRCEVEQGGFLPDGVSAMLQAVDGRTHYVQVTGGLINTVGGDSYLPVGIVEIDRRNRQVLVELPVEADSGANRMWIAFDSLRQERSLTGGAVA